MPATRKKYSKEFKLEAVRLLEAGGKAGHDEEGKDRGSKEGGRR